MAAGIRNPRMGTNLRNLPTSANTIQDKSTSLVRGQLLLVNCDEGFDYIPCFPKPGTSKTITRVYNKTWVLFLGTVEFNGVTCLEFMTQDNKERFYLGDGALHYLINIPQIKLKRGTPAKKQFGSKLDKKRNRRSRKLTKLKKLSLPTVVEQK